MICYMMPCEVEYKQVECHISEIANVLNKVRKQLLLLIILEYWKQPIANE